MCVTFLSYQYYSNVMYTLKYNNPFLSVIELIHNIDICAQFFVMFVPKIIYCFPLFTWGVWSFVILCKQSLRWKGKKGQKSPWSLLKEKKNMLQISIQVVKRNLLIKGECCRHRSDYLSIFFHYIGMMKLFFFFVDLSDNFINKLQNISLCQC